MVETGESCARIATMMRLNTLMPPWPQEMAARAFAGVTSAERVSAAAAAVIDDARPARACLDRQGDQPGDGDASCPSRLADDGAGRPRRLTGANAVAGPAPKVP